ncbi:serine/threonine-protein kinase TBK1-like [Anneissia japonica]|uniref:serine/threonine-protein kinase TBK1-like n=1 Tax=Anneissia japonica TaxID=1529436 RepID=UPI0014256E9D|nr:serine/threonine-protein kinase TBK1-like [Anneissia japonica]
MSRQEQLKSTRSYIWYTGHVLGTGATSNVYIGRHKKTGEQVAVKTFNSASFSRPHEVQVRELDVIRKLKHKNIVDLLAIEDDQITKQPVIIMELCMGGSLYSILEEPQNIFGLKEEEFLIVLRDVTSGMKYLRETNIVHRDLKPGNIMRVIAEDNTSIYKLADFGAARELQEGGEFMSLYGTEEYLHPDLYQRAVLKVANRGRYSAKIDLWSVGVTFYHVATGQLPFRPYGGRKNRETMIFLTTKKPNGVISGVQHESPNGKIDWSSQLPETCHLPRPLKRQVRLLLAGLLECELDKMLSFNDYFHMVQEILNLQKVHVFNAVTAQTVNIYIHPGSGWDKFTKSVEEETHISTEQQLLCFKDQILDVNTISMDNRNYPETTAQNPIILLRKDLKKFPSPIPPDKPKLPKIATPYSLENDAPLAKICCGSMYYYLTIVQSLLLMQEQMRLAVNCFCGILQNKIKESQVNLETLKTHKVYIEENCKWLMSNLDIDLLQIIPDHLKDEINEELEMRAALLKEQLMLMQQEYNQEILVNSVHPLFDEFHKLFRKIIQDNVLEVSYDDQQKCQPHEHCYNRFEVLVKGTKTISDQFRDDKRAKRLAYNEEQIHKMDKQKLSMQCTQGMSLLNEHCELKWREQHNRLGSWYTRAFFEFQSVMILLQNTENTIRIYCVFRDRLDKLKRQHDKISDDVKQVLRKAFQKKDTLYLKGKEPSQARSMMSPTFIHTSQERIKRKKHALVTKDQFNQLNSCQEDMRKMRGDVQQGVSFMRSITEEIK